MTSSRIRLANPPHEDADCSVTQPCTNPDCDGGHVYRWTKGRWTTPGFAEMGVAFSGPYRKPYPCPDCRGSGVVPYWQGRDDER